MGDGGTCECMGGTWVKGVGGMCGMCLARGGMVVEGVRDLGLGFPILYEQGVCGTCVCVWVSVVLGEGIGGQGLGGWCVVSPDYLCRWPVPGICIFC